MDARQEKGLQIANVAQITKNPLGWKVPSQSGNGSYIVNLDGDEPYCTCPDFETRHERCKHIWAVEFIMSREDRSDGTTVITKTMRVTYKQDWPAYNAAQTHEQEDFVILLKRLCEGLEQPKQGNGRPRLPISDVVFGITFKVYSTMSARRFMSDLRDATEKGLVGKAPSFTSTFRYLENPDLTPVLKALIEQSASPLQSVEANFAVDSSGFATSVYDRWFDHKYGKMRSEAKWIKAHIMCGVTTNIVTSAEVTATETADAPQLPGLLEQTARRFDIAEVSADKAYSSIRNLHVIDALGAKPYIPFKGNATGNGHGHRVDGLWNYMLAYYNFNRGEFLTHYHKRSNVESTFSMIKAKFGASVRAKTPVAQVNEVLCKILCHNICVVIQSMYELGIEAVFPLAVGCSKSHGSVPKLAWE